MRIRILILIGSSLLISSCATPQTILSKGHDVVVCGGSSVGSVAGGLIGYSIQKSNDEKCVQDHKADGYVISKHSDE